MFNGLDVEKGLGSGLLAHTGLQGMEWQDLSFRIGEHQILSHVTGLIEPGRLCGVFGPSGCGKTTLLNLLSGRQRTHGHSRNGGSLAPISFSGDVFARGVPVKPKYFRGKAAFVYQDNALPPYETPRECLEFSAYLRLPRCSKETRAKQVDSLLLQLHLESCADNMVGSLLYKGISGGEAKRVAIGVELISNPRLLFLDEPLSGLDSFNAFVVASSLRTLAETKVPVIMSIHQPSSEIFSQLHDVLVLHKGEVCYLGRAEQLVAHFQQLGFPCPSHYNPADHAIFVMQKETEESSQIIKSKWGQSAMFQELLKRISHAGIAAGNAALIDESGSSSGDESIDSGDESKGCCRLAGHRNCCAVQCAILRRDLRKTFRECCIAIWVYFTILLVSLSYGWVFLGAGSKEDSSMHAPNCLAATFELQVCLRRGSVHYSLMALLGVMTMMNSLTYALGVFQVDRAFMIREVAAGYYSVASYFFSKCLFEIMQVGLGCIINVMGCYWLGNLRGNFGYLVVDCLLLSMSSSSIMYCLSAVARNETQAYSLSVLPQVPQLVFSGILIPSSMVPTSLMWVKWICPLFYGVRMMGRTEFNYVFEELERCGGQCADFPGLKARADFLKAMDIMPDTSWWMNIWPLLVIMVGFRAMAVLILQWKSRYVV